MVTAWYLDSTSEDVEAENKGDVPHYLSKEDLFEKSRVQCFDIDLTMVDKEDSVYQQLRKERGYNYEDEISVDPEKLPNFEAVLATFTKEHIHGDEEIRLCVDGSAYIDVRDVKDKWIRMQLDPGNLVIIPAGIYHRLTMRKDMTITARRLFKGSPIWTAFYRPAEEHPARINYLKSVGCC